MKSNLIGYDMFTNFKMDTDKAIRVIGFSVQLYRDMVKLF